MSLSDAVSTILTRNAFYRDGYRLLLRISLVQGIVVVLLIATLISMVLSMDTRHIYFATTADGRIINIVPLNEPYRSRGDVVAWAAGKAREVMNFGYNNYRQSLQTSSVNFTPSGWETFTKAMKDARILEAIEARKLTVKMHIESAPEVKKAGVKDGVYTWLLQFPVNIKFDGVDAPASIMASLVLRVVRVSTLQNPEGISIEQWVTVGRE